MDFTEIKEKAKRKREELRYKRERITDAMSRWARENPREAGEALLGIGSALIFGGSRIYAANSKRKRLKEEFEASECSQYDPRTGMYLYTKRPLTNKQKIELSRRMKNGEYKADILSDMKLL